MGKEVMPIWEKYTDGTVSDVNTGNIAAIDSEEAVALAERVAKTGKSRGYVHRYKYRKTKTADGTMYIFLDCSRDLGSVMQFLRTSILIAALAFCGISSLVILMLTHILNYSLVELVPRMSDRRTRHDAAKRYNSYVGCAAPYIRYHARGRTVDVKTRADSCRHRLLEYI